MYVLGLTQVKLNQQFITNNQLFITFGYLHNVYHTQTHTKNPLLVPLFSLKKIKKIVKTQIMVTVRYFQPNSVGFTNVKLYIFKSSFINSYIKHCVLFCTVKLFLSFFVMAKAIKLDITFHRKCE